MKKNNNLNKSTFPSSPVSRKSGESLLLINTAIQAAIKAGKEILSIYNDPQSDFSIERKADNSPLTIADKASHRIINELLQDTNLPLLSEEGKQISYAERKNWESFWLVDPLDGTKEFIKRNDEFTVNIALITNGKPEMGVIYVPVTGTLYVGITGTGTWKLENVTDSVNFEILQQSGEKLTGSIPHETYTVIGSRSHRNEETNQYIDKLREKHPQLEIISRGSSLKICQVAEGLADEYPRFGPTMEWDTAAGHAIANAAGKKLWLTDYSQELNYNKENLLNPYFIVK